MSILVASRRLALAAGRISLKTPLPMKISKLYSPSIQYVFALDLKNYSHYSMRSNPADVLRTSPLIIEQLQKSEIDFKNLFDLCESILKEQNLVTANVSKLCQTISARLFYNEKRIDSAIQMFRFLQTLNPEDTQPAAYASLMGSFRGNGEQHEKVILEIWVKLKEFSDVFPSTLLSYITEGLCETSRWKEALNLIEMEKVVSMRIHVPMWTPICIRAIKEGDVDTVHYLLTNMIIDFYSGNRHHVTDLIQELFQLVKDDQVEFTMKDFCDVLEIMRHQPDKLVAGDIQNYFDEEMLQWTCVSTSVTKWKYCSSCGHLLPEAKLSQTEMDGLKDQILNKLILKSNVYLNTNPDEVQRFLKMVEREGPFDVVLDGCNVGIKQLRGESILLAVNYFKKKKMKKILVIGRDHMMAWKHMNEVQESAIFFPVANISKDDPFILYAACHSPDTYFVSQDYYSNMLHSDIDKEYYQIFCKWLCHRQIKDYSFNKYKVDVRPPIRTDIVPSYNNEKYHIPYMDDDKIYWLCATKQS